MQIVFFTQNKHFLEIVSSLAIEKHQLWYRGRLQSKSAKEDGILFIDYDDPDFELATFEKLIEKQYPALRFFSKMLISEKLTTKEMKKVQSENRFIDGIIRAPIQLKDIENYIEDYNLVHHIVQVEDNDLRGPSMGSETNKKSQEKPSGNLELNLDEGLGELEFESSAPPIGSNEVPKKEISQKASDSESFFELDSLFEAELENANANAMNQDKGTQKTIFYDRSRVTSSDVGAFSVDKVALSSDQTKSSSDVLISRPDIEFTVKDILVPKNLKETSLSSADKTQEMNLADLVDESNKRPEQFDQEEVDFELNDEAFSLTTPAAPKLDSREEDVTFSTTQLDRPFESHHEEVMTPFKNAIDEIPKKPHDHYQVGITTEESARIQGTLRQLREERELLLEQIKQLKGHCRELEQDNLTLKAALDESKIEIAILRKRHLSEIEDMNYRLSLSEEKKAISEEKAKVAEGKREKLEQRIRMDFSQVKQREKELESKLEMLTVDVDSQVQSRDQKILELRRKIDSLEFNMENISIKEQKTLEDKRKLEDKLSKMMKTLRHSIKHLEDDMEQSSDEHQDETEGRIRRLKA